MPLVLAGDKLNWETHRQKWVQLLNELCQFPRQATTTGNQLQCLLAGSKHAFSIPLLFFDVLVSL